MKTFAKAASILALAVPAVGVLAAGPASATALIPLVNYKAGYVTLTNASGGIAQRNACTYRGGSMSPPKYVANGCAVRVWLYQNSNDSGSYNLCINPRSSTGALGREYRSYWVSSNSAKC
ncbi:MAG TPA: hypothetical protein VKV33_00720 [Streptosporangiaceae bacterium]|nr:hypothetical protein [Streptosporangiaceae bacterium]